MPNLMDPIFYTDDKLLSISRQVPLGPHFSCGCSERHIPLRQAQCFSWTTISAPLQGEGEVSVLWAPKCAPQLPWREHAVHRPSSSDLSLNTYWTFSKSSAFSFC